ncbi:hypothetical protein N7488_010976 [Penicillium malachiteum]|nr:hypothetical protein N7488_010976 [Penicillium malachiteum]
MFCDETPTSLEERRPMKEINGHIGAVQKYRLKCIGATDKKSQYHLLNIEQKLRELAQREESGADGGMNSQVVSQEDLACGDHIRNGISIVYPGKTARSERVVVVMTVDAVISGFPPPSQNGALELAIVPLNVDAAFDRGDSTLQTQKKQKSVG